MASTRVTIIDEERRHELPATPDGEDLWLDAAELAATGWQRKAAGLCRGALCVPLPTGRQDDLVRTGGAVNLAALARLRGQPVVHDQTSTVWLFDPPASTQQHLRETLIAPDFTLPDLEGRPHPLAAERGKKVLLVSWASW